MLQNICFSIGRVIDNTYRALGTCTLINIKNLMVTAAHVVNGNDSDLFIKANDNFQGGYQDTTIDTCTLIPVKIKAIDPLRDVCILTFKDGSTGYSGLKIGNCDSSIPGDDVTVLGFPHSDLGRIVLTQQSCEIGAKILLSSKGIKSKHLVLNIQARPGQSGGPIIRTSDNTIIAILIGAYVPTIEAGIIIGGINPQTLHQTTHAVSAEYIERML
ncbi:S1 family peptidase [Bacillus thuringiensis]|uniref:S1 family peptidase n=1 Tax=Bacillus thuringiensis TaxID=1428 RepID=UPI000BFE1CE5|nr:serine protease [Bacillus thuringiensis]PGM45485.1 serine protease [Bacillus thuringiensis]